MSPHVILYRRGVPRLPHTLPLFETWRAPSLQTDIARHLYISMRIAPYKFHPAFRTIIYLQLIAEAPLQHDNTSLQHARTSFQHANTSFQHANTPPQHTNTSFQNASTSFQHTNTSPQHANTSPQHANTSPQHTNTSFQTTSTSPQHTNTPFQHTNTTTRPTNTPTQSKNHKSRTHLTPKIHFKSSRISPNQNFHNIRTIHNIQAAVCRHIYPPRDSYKTCNTLTATIQRCLAIYRDK